MVNSELGFIVRLFDREPVALATVIEKSRVA
jgi:hypothetical protein